MKVLDRVEKAIENAKKLTTKDRKKLKKSTFCGPNRSFPVPDCQHVASAKAFLNRSKFSKSTKQKIATCINRRAKALKCNGDKKAKVKAKAYTTYTYDNLTKEAQALYNSTIFDATRKLVEDSLVIPNNI